MKLNDMLHQINTPCAKCPYKLGVVHAVINPCPQCKENGYQMCERLQQRIYNFDGESRQERKNEEIR